MDPKFGMYLAYLAITVGLTYWVARTLFRNGKVFLRDALASDELAESVNRLLVVGFYLLNLGYATYAMRTSDDVDDPTRALETLSTKIGIVMLALGLIHLGNLFVLSRFRKRAQHHNLAALVPPHLPPGRPQAPRQAPIAYPMPVPTGPQGQHQPTPPAGAPGPQSGHGEDVHGPGPAQGTDPGWRQPQ